MANTASAAKRARQTIRRTRANRLGMGKVKRALRQMRDALKAGDKTKATTLVVKTSSALDKAVKAGRIHKNKANRNKSKLALAVAALK